LQVYRLVIAKHFAHQLKDIASHQEALYANWPNWCWQQKWHRGSPRDVD
jgi:hypothetical protein